MLAPDDQRKEVERPGAGPGTVVELPREAARGPGNDRAPRTGLTRRMAEGLGRALPASWTWGESARLCWPLLLPRCTSQCPAKTE